MKKGFFQKMVERIEMTMRYSLKESHQLKEFVTKLKAMVNRKNKYLFVL